MTHDRQPPSTRHATRAWWRVTKTIQPGARGAIRLLHLHGDRLVCVRYRTSGTGDERLTTVELIVDRAVIRKRVDRVVAFKLKPGETALRRTVLQLGATFDATTGLWRLARRHVLSLGLRGRIVMSEDDMLREDMANARNRLLRVAK